MKQKETYQRKIQLVADSTYTISLPKQWITKHGLKEKQHLEIQEAGDGSLILSAQRVQRQKQNEEFRLQIDSLNEDLTQALFVLYYLGFEKIVLQSKKDISLDALSQIKKTLRYMVGTEIVAEDEKEVTIRVLLDKEKVEIIQIFYRMALLISSSIDLLIERKDQEEIKRNEEETDRLYHLTSKIILLSHGNATIRQSSKIGDVHYLTSLQLIAKKLENIEDAIYALSIILQKKQMTNELATLLTFVKEHAKGGMLYLLNRESKTFTKTGHQKLDDLKASIKKMKEDDVIKLSYDLLRYLNDVEEELTNISFITRLLREGVI